MSRHPARGEFIETDTGNKVSRKAAHLKGTPCIMLGGKVVILSDVMIRGDLVRQVPSSSANNISIAIGRYCFLSKGCSLRPPGRMHKGIFTYLPLRMGEHVFIGEGCQIAAASIGNHVEIQKGVTVGEFVIIKDYVRVLEDAVLPANMVVPSFSIVSGKPARVVGEIPEGAHDSFDLKEAWKSIGNYSPSGTQA